MIIRVKDVGVHPSGIIDIVVHNVEEFIKTLSERKILDNTASVVFLSRDRAVIVLKEGVVVLIRQTGPAPMVR